jgi:hypothetical protein
LLCAVDVTDVGHRCRPRFESGRNRHSVDRSEQALPNRARAGSKSQKPQATENGFSS